MLGYGWAQGPFQGVRMKPNGTAWSQNDTKRESETGNMDPKIIKMEPKASEVRQKAMNKSKANAKTGTEKEK